jgi:hypothetical protein
MAALEDGGAPIRVPIAETVIAAWQAVFTRLSLALELGWLPLLLLMAVALLPDLVTDYLWPSAAVGIPPILDLGDIAEAIIAALALGAFAVRWTQTLLPEAPATRRPFLRPFLLYALVFFQPIVGLLAASALPSAPSAGDVMAASSSALAAVLVIAVSFLLPRLALMIPSAAYGRPLSVKAAWRHMRGNGWRIAAVTFIVWLPIVFVFGVALDILLLAAHYDPTEALAGAPPLGFFLLEGTLEVLLNFLFVALLAAVLAEFYRRVVLRSPRSVR